MERNKGKPIINTNTDDIIDLYENCKSFILNKINNSVTRAKKSHTKGKAFENNIVKRLINKIQNQELRNKLNRLMI